MVSSGKQLLSSSEINREAQAGRLIERKYGTVPIVFEAGMYYGAGLVSQNVGLCRSQRRGSLKHNSPKDKKGPETGTFLLSPI
jgi:hypothetical protein